LAVVTVAGLASFTATAATPPTPSNLFWMANHTVSGTVVDANGSPQANMAVKLLKTGAGKSGPAVRQPGQSPTGDSSIGTPDANQLQAKIGRNEAVLKETKTDAAGKFTLTDIPPGHYNLFADAGNKSVKQDLEVKADADPAPVTIKLMK